MAIRKTNFAVVITKRKAAMVAFLVGFLVYWSLYWDVQSTTTLFLRENIDKAMSKQEQQEPPFDHLQYLRDLARNEVIPFYQSRKDKYAQRNRSSHWKLRGTGYLYANKGIALVATLPEDGTTGPAIIRIDNVLPLLHGNQSTHFQNEKDYCSRLTIWVRVNGPEIFAGKAVSVVDHSRNHTLSSISSCHWEFPFDARVPGVYQVDAKVMVWNGSRDPVDVPYDGLSDEKTQSRCRLEKGGPEVVTENVLELASKRYAAYFWYDSQQHSSVKSSTATLIQQQLQNRRHLLRQNHLNANPNHSPSNNNSSLRFVSGGFIGFKFYYPSRSCCEVCSRIPGCIHWATPPKLYPDAPYNRNGCELYFERTTDFDPYEWVPSKLQSGIMPIEANHTNPPSKDRYHGNPATNLVSTNEIAYFVGCGWSYWFALDFPCLSGDLDDRVYTERKAFVFGKLPSYIEHDWAELPADAKHAAQALGYNQSIWDNDQIPDSVSEKSWKHLTAAEKTAAAVFGYTQERWHYDDDDDKNSSEADKSVTSSGWSSFFTTNSESTIKIHHIDGNSTHIVKTTTQPPLPQQLPLCSLEHESFDNHRGRWIRAPLPNKTICPNRGQAKVGEWSVTTFEPTQPSCWYWDNLMAYMGCKEINCRFLSPSATWISSLHEEMDWYGYWQHDDCDYLEFTEWDLQKCITKQRISSIDFEGVSIASILQTFTEYRTQNIKFYDGPRPSTHKQITLSTLGLLHLLPNSRERLVNEFRSKPNATKNHDYYLMSTYFLSSEREPLLYNDYLYNISVLSEEILREKGWKMLNAYDLSAAFTYDSAGQNDGMHILGPPAKTIVTKFFHYLCSDSTNDSDKNSSDSDDDIDIGSRVGKDVPTTMPSLV